MIKFSEILNEKNYIARVEQVMLVIDFECNCRATVTYAAFDRNYYGEDDDSANPNKCFWSDNQECNCGHEDIDFSELKKVQLSEACTEISMGFGINITVGKEPKCMEYQKGWNIQHYTDGSKKAIRVKTTHSQKATDKPIL